MSRFSFHILTLVLFMLLLIGLQPVEGAPLADRDFSGYIDGDVCVVDGLPVVLSSSYKTRENASLDILYQRTNGDVVLLVLESESFGGGWRRAGMDKIASGTCPQ